MFPHLVLIYKHLIFPPPLSMKKHLPFSLLLLVGIVVSSCMHNCDEFTPVNPLTAWLIFADTKDSYTFVNKNADTVVFQQTTMGASEAYSRFGVHLCRAHLDLRYNCPQLSLRADAFLKYSSKVSPAVGWITYAIDNSSDDFPIEDGQPFPLEQQTDSPYKITLRDQLQVLDTVYTEVHEFEVLAKQGSVVQRFWIKKGVGMIGFEHKGVVWGR